MENVNEQEQVEVIETDVEVDESEQLIDDAENKTYTAAEMKQLLLSESDKRVEEALKTNRFKWEKEAEEKQKEALRLASLSEEEKWKEELANREKAVVEKELRIQQLELSEFATSKLSEFQLPNSISKFVVSKDEETTLANIQLFKKEFDTALNARVKDKLETRTPPKGNSSITSAMTQEKYDALPLREQSRLYTENPEQMKQFI